MVGLMQNILLTYRYRQSMTVKHQDPTIFVIDIDGTLVGDVSFQVCEWEILQMYEPKKLKAFRQKLIEHLRNGLMRPFIADFIASMKQNNEYTEFFLYTASDDKWAQFFVPCIEVACGYKFARPIFSRKHCLQFDKSLKKSLIKISNQVFARLKIKYANLLKSRVHLAEHMILIDNNKVLVDKETRKGIICPSYEQKITYDILRNLDDRLFHMHAYHIAQILEKYDLIEAVTSSRTSSYMLLSLYYASLSSHMKDFAKVDHTSRKDRYWLTLGNLIISLQQRDIPKDSMIKYINKKMHTS